MIMVYIDVNLYLVHAIVVPFMIELLINLIDKMMNLIPW
jgi:hypothetical protein